MTKQWWKESVVYQIYPRSFMDSNGDGIGDLRGIISKLDYLQKLGIDVVWLSPVYESPNDDNGYDISDYRKIMTEFGTMEDWEELLHEMHKRNIKLMMDLVVNHTSDEHNWFIESRKSKDNPYRDYYIWRSGKEGKEPNNWESAFSGSAWQYDETTDEYYLHLFSKKQPDLNWDNEQVRKDVYDMMKFWFEKGIDGFRMDVINFISKEEGLPTVETEEKGYVSGHQYFMNGPNIHTYLHEMNREVLSKYDIMTVGEMPGVTTEEAKLYTAEERQELQMVFQFEHMDLDSGEGGKWDIKPYSLLTLKQNLTKWQKALEYTGWNSLYWNNHDQPRVVSRFGNDTTYRIEAAKMLATVLHMMKGTPYIYQGEEIGMTNVRFDSINEYRDIETLNMYREKVIERGENEEQVMQSIYVKGRDNARTPMQWNQDKHAGFTTGEPWIRVNPNYKEINVEQALQDSESIFYYYKKLIELRKKHEIIVYGTYDLILENHPSIFAYVRTWKDEQLLVIANFTENECLFELPKEITYYLSELVIHNYDVQDGTLESFVLQPYEARVYKLKS
ncbi:MULTISPECIES: glycoside hydrolase family 13 protein [Bacillus cereus group]|uniref:oligo-1,6-glucosidase n=1 Tax=Bacillus cytotoxicus (strain DSM 22905 / CIP 110041 / 391-98 / NVH 391-98) TaxID=315749 RepID=A7GS42_BACCN|nr:MULTISPECIES: alpha-glucosidase [Bacillus cereus group]ABS22950.1 alpha amylase catalytic region [Bacillus cytotoxicus NVH 391-98]AWC29606.1 alpha-glucosidase [Bacillus cytotoxicus]AWC41738.1 alpha-glucosidase [Bacillus cytotoxicus]AWC45582.1 alpha-glucosidase [Bacillus cytotoxicus]AWC49669.1 alpha-glucosidase [Bacillus cytotoxicus]